MKLEMRRLLARESFEEKIRKVEQLIRLAREFRRQREKSGATQPRDADRTNAAH